MTPAGGWHGAVPHGHAARFEVGAAVANFSPPLRGHAPGGDPANCGSSSAFNGRRPFAFEDPYTDTNGNGHYDPGEPFADCGGTGRWEGNLLGGGSNTPRFYTRVADPVTARALVVGNGSKTIAVEVVDQEGLFDTYQQRIRALVAAAGIHLRRDLHLRDPRRVGARQPWARRRRPDDVGHQQLLGQLHGPPERAGDRAGVSRDAPGSDPLHRGARALERTPVLVVVPVRRRSARPGPTGRLGGAAAASDRDAGERLAARRDARLQRRHAGARRAGQLGVRRLDQLLPPRAPAALRRGRDRDGRRGRVEREPGGLLTGDLTDSAAVHRRVASGRLQDPVRRRPRDRCGGPVARAARLRRRDEGVRRRHGEAGDRKR